MVVFGIREYARKAGVAVVKNAGASVLTRNTISRMMRRGSMVYTDRWNGYDTLVMIGCKQVCKPR